MGVCKGDQGRDSGPRRLDVPSQVELQQTLWNDIVIHKLKVEDIFKNDQKTWRMCSTKSGAITAERSQSSLESRRNSHSWLQKITTMIILIDRDTEYDKDGDIDYDEDGDIDFDKIPAQLW